MQRRPLRSLNASPDPAVLTSQLLLRIGFGVLAVAVPVVAPFSRRSIFILLPFGAGLIVLAAAMIDIRRGARRLLDQLLSPIGLAAIVLAVWAGLSIIWTPFRFEAGVRLFKDAGTGALAMIAVAFLPERMRLSSLYLLPIGLAIAAAIALAYSLNGAARLVEGSELDTFTLERGTLTLVIMIWPALAALAARRRVVSAVALALGIVVATAAVRQPDALVALVLGGLVYGAAVADQKRTANVLAIVFALLVMSAPLLPALIVFGAKLATGGVPDALQPFAAWAHVLGTQKQRLLTGHGLETLRGFAASNVGVTASHGVLFEVWYELGTIGAVALAFILAAAFRAADRRAEGVAPYLIAGLTSAIILAMLDQDGTRLWWVTLLAVAAISFGGVVHGQYRTRRPSLRPVIGSRPQSSVL
jgi:hypothetical protein